MLIYIDCVYVDARPAELHVIVAGYSSYPEGSFRMTWTYYSR